ncbi:hsp70-binding protein 1 isoform X2 [Halyomorpha halys]|uniref:hsp70-binding protein 1 isoform X2 n=1 Tax=Halyomorpha halys TaxID=286706 RepID=UPI0006D5146C|nr:hsp70-binding protein 1 isoform X2 [Halyomorpha halys]
MRVWQQEYNRRRFLEEVLKSMTVDMAKELADAINKLKTMENPETTLESSEYEAALDTISDFVDHIDAAIDFFKLGGFDIVHTCLQSTCPGVRSRMADVVAVCTQNNPFCQGHAVTMNFLPRLLNIVEHDSDDECKLKAFYAVSCIVRDNSEALTQFSNLDGFSVVLRSMNSNNERLIVKAAFFTTSMLSKNVELRDDLVRMGFVEKLIRLLKSPHGTPHEHFASSLVWLVQNNEEAQDICKRPEYHFEMTLRQLINEYGQDDAYREEMVSLRQLLEIIFNNDNEEER